MTKQFKIQPHLLPSNRRQQLINLTAQLVAKMVETQTIKEKGGETNEQ